MPGRLVWHAPLEGCLKARRVADGGGSSHFRKARQDNALTLWWYHATHTSSEVPSRRIQQTVTAVEGILGVSRAGLCVRWRRLITSPLGALWGASWPLYKPTESRVTGYYWVLESNEAVHRSGFWILWTVGCISFRACLFYRWWTAGSYFKGEEGWSLMPGHLISPSALSSHTHLCQCQCWLCRNQCQYFFLLTYNTLNIQVSKCYY